MAQQVTAAGSPTQPESPEQRLEILYAKWHEFQRKLEQAIAAHHEMRKSNLRGNMILIEREIRRLGGEAPSSRSPGTH